MQTEIQREPVKAPRHNQNLNVDPAEAQIYEFHEDMSAAPKGSIFVFGSNLAGFHGAGAAWAARQFYGAVLGVGEGPTGASYAIPTKDYHIITLPIEEVAKAVKRFVRYTHEHPDTKFFVTRVGCGLAGFTDEQIAPMFAGAQNCSFAQEWMEYLL